MLKLETEQLVALCLKDHKRVSFEQIWKIQDALVRDHKMIDIIDISRDSFSQIEFYYHGYFRFEEGFIERNRPEMFEGDYINYEFLNAVREKGICVGEVSRVIDSHYEWGI